MQNIDMVMNAARDALLAGIAEAAEVPGVAVVEATVDFSDGGDTRWRLTLHLGACPEGGESQ